MTGKATQEERMDRIVADARASFAATGAGAALTSAEVRKVRALRQTITHQIGQIEDLRDLLALALPYVEEAASDPAHKPEPVKVLAARIRAAVESKV